MQDSVQSQSIARPQPAVVPPPEQESESATQLVAGMAHDVKHLGEQYLELVKLEIAQGIASIKRELIKRLIGGSSLAVGALFLALALYYAATEEFGWPRWVAFGVLALIAIAGGSAMLLKRGSGEDKGADALRGSRS